MIGWIANKLNRIDGKILNLRKQDILSKFGITLSWVLLPLTELTKNIGLTFDSSKHF